MLIIILLILKFVAMVETSSQLCPSVPPSLLHDLYSLYLAVLSPACTFISLITLALLLEYIFYPCLILQRMNHPSSRKVDPRHIKANISKNKSKQRCWL